MFTFLHALEGDIPQIEAQLSQNYKQSKQNVVEAKTKKNVPSHGSILVLVCACTILFLFQSLQQ